MNRMLKAGIALVAALALTAVMASAASAQFTSSSAHTILSGEQEVGTNDVFTAGEGFGGITCVNTSFSGTGGATSEATQVITPTYSNCSDSFGRTVDIDNSGLTYTFTSGAGKGTVHVSGGMTLTVTSGGSVVCTVVITSPQTNNGITYTNVPHEHVTEGKNTITRYAYVKTHTKATNVKSTTSGGFFNCGISNGEHTAGTYTGTAVIKGTNTAGEGADISVD